MASVTYRVVRRRVDKFALEAQIGLSDWRTIGEFRTEIEAEASKGRLERIVFRMERTPLTQGALMPGRDYQGVAGRAVARTGRDFEAVCSGIGRCRRERRQGAFRCRFVRHLAFVRGPLLGCGLAERL
jgi:hypothetical protein